jgi:hypothetical protein
MVKVHENSLKFPLVINLNLTIIKHSKLSLRVTSIDYRPCLMEWRSLIQIFSLPFPCVNMPKFKKIIIIKHSKWITFA